MRLIGAAERGMQLMAQRALSRKAFGKMIAQHGSFISDLAKVLIRFKNKNLFQFHLLHDLCLLSYRLFSAE
jgi:acyl-CoA dehydrogenase